MNCEQAETLLPQYVFEELADEQQADVQAHVDACPSCRRAVGDLRVSLKLLREQIITEPAPVLSDAAKAALLAHVKAGAEAAAPPSKPPGPIRRLARRMSVRSVIGTAAAVLLLGIGLWMSLPELAKSRESAKRTRAYAGTAKESVADELGRIKWKAGHAPAASQPAKKPAKSGKYYREAGRTEAVATERLYRAIGEVQYDAWGVNEDRDFRLSAEDAPLAATAAVQADYGSKLRRGSLIAPADADRYEPENSPLSAWDFTLGEGESLSSYGGLQRKSSGGCFVAGTLVMTNEGPRAIESIKADTQVYSGNSKTGEWVRKPVIMPLRHDYVGDVFTIEVGGVKVEATGNHPFWVVRGEELAARPPVRDISAKEQEYTDSGRWVEARDLQVGDALQAQKGGTVKITKLSFRYDSLEVYNLNVAGLHTYGVSTIGILVHNKDAGDVFVEGSDKAARGEKKADAKSRWEKSIEAIGAEKTNVMTDWRWSVQKDADVNAPGDDIHGSAQYHGEFLSEGEANTASRSKRYVSGFLDWDGRGVLIEEEFGVDFNDDEALGSINLVESDDEAAWDFTADEPKIISGSVAGVTIVDSGTPSSTFVTDAAESDTYTVVLDLEPTADVTITIDAGSPLATDPDTPPRESLDWNSPQPPPAKPQSAPVRMHKKMRLAEAKRRPAKADRLAVRGAAEAISDIPLVVAGSRSRYTRENTPIIVGALSERGLRHSSRPRKAPAADAPRERRSSRPSGRRMAEMSRQSTAQRKQQRAKVRSELEAVKESLARGQVLDLTRKREAKRSAGPAAHGKRKQRAIKRSGGGISLAAPAVSEKPKRRASESRVSSRRSRNRGGRAAEMALSEPPAESQLRTGGPKRSGLLGRIFGGRSSEPANSEPISLGEPEFRDMAEPKRDLSRSPRAQKAAELLGKGKKSDRGVDYFNKGPLYTVGAVTSNYLARSPRALKAAELLGKEAKPPRESAEIRRAEKQRVQKPRISASIMHSDPEPKYLVYPEDWADMPSRTPEPQWKKNIRKKMEKKVSFDFVETSLVDAFRFLQTQADVPIVLDPQVEQSGIGDTSINLKIGDMRLERALHWILRLADLEYVLKNEVIFISAPENLGIRTVLRYYQFDDLTFQTKQSTSTMAAMIRNRVQPYEWHPDTSIKQQSGQLVVEATPATHAQVQALLKYSRAASNEPAPIVLPREKDEGITKQRAASRRQRVVKKPKTVTKPEAEEKPGKFKLPDPASFKAGPVNPFVMTGKDRFATFALDVDTASYTLARAFINHGYRPPPASVRMEEFINAFDYNYPSQAGRVFNVHVEAAPAPFGGGGGNMVLLKIGVQARVVGRQGRKPAHLVFVVDASGSMARPDRLPLVRYALSLAIGQLAARDRVSLVAYSNRARLVIEAVPIGNAQEKVKAIQRIRQAVYAIQPGGSTNLHAGLRGAYQLARRYFRAGEINRVVLLSDGVANIGQTDAKTLLAEVEGYKRQGITFSSVGFGLGAYNDELLETLSNRGDGSYMFVDSAAEARRVFTGEFAAALQTVARDAKIQVEFNPRQVRRYRLIGYENRAIADKDFRNDAVDAGEVGSGQAVTALFELELTGGARPLAARSKRAPIALTDLGTVFVRYRNDDTGEIEEISQRLPASLIKHRSPSAYPRFNLAACAAEFAEILRESEHAAGSNLQAVQRILEEVAARLPLDKKVEELLTLVQSAQGLPTPR